MNDRPPCWPKDQTKPNPCALAHYNHVVNGHVDLRADWLGWKQRGRHLVAPSGERISPERMTGLLWRIAQEERLAKLRARNAARSSAGRLMVKVVVVNLADWHAQRFGSRAG